MGSSIYELYKNKIDWTQKGNGFFVYVLWFMGELSIWCTPMLTFVCVFMLIQYLQFDGPNGVYIYVLWSMDPMGFLFVLWSNIQFDRSMGFIFVCYDLWQNVEFDGTMGVMDTTFTWQMEFIHINAICD